MERVIVTRCWNGLIGMNVCAVKDATDEEILDVCNKENPSGTTNGWVDVVRDIRGREGVIGDKCAPVQCDDYLDRMHFVVIC